MKPSLRLLVLFVALLAVLPATALAFLPAPGDQLAQVVQLRALRLGDRGERVADLQRLLRERGFDPGPLDGIFGPLTLAAVRGAQAHHQLEVDGLAGRLTVGALRQESTVSAAPSAAGGLVIYQAGPPAQLGANTAPAPLETAQAVRLASDTGLLRPVHTVWERLSGAVPAMAPAASPVALTFNGLPDEESLDAILSQLQARSMRATFFVPGDGAEERPDLLTRINEAGHEVASLGYTELDMRRVSPITARALLRRTQRAVAEAIGKEPVYFRPPLGLFDQPLNRLVEEEGLRLMLWSNVSVRPVPEMEPERLAEHWAGSLFPRAVLMLPLEKENALEAVEPLLERMEAGGYTSRTLSELMEQR